MAQPSVAHNPFMLMLDPEVVLSAVQRSEKLEQLSRRICHPLDRPMPPNGNAGHPNGPAAKPPHEDD